MQDKKIEVLVFCNFLLILLVCILIWNNFFRSDISSNPPLDNITKITKDESEVIERSKPVKQSLLQTNSLFPILEDVNSAVVNITTKGKISISNNPFFNDPFFQNFFRFNEPLEKETQSIGSGVIVDDIRGHVLTNYHVVKDAEEIYVTLLDGRKITAELIGSDQETDLAVLMIEADNLTSILVSNYVETNVGDYVLAIGNPFGLGHTVTYGIISAIERSNANLLKGYDRLIQTDASINPGNSGGALINLKGELIGINTAILSKGGANVGIGFAIPVDIVQKIISQLINYGNVIRGNIGIETKKIEILEGQDNLQGAAISSVAPNSNAEKVGIQENDVIISVNNMRILTPSSFESVISLFRVGENIELVILRDGIRKNVNVSIAEIKKSKSNYEEINPPNDIVILQGAIFINSDNGILITSVEDDSSAYRIGLRKNDLIKQVNQINIINADDLFLAAKLRARGIVIRLVRGDTSILIIQN